MDADQDSPRRFDVILAGEYYYDIIFTGLPHEPRLGGDLWSTGLGTVPGGNYTTALAFKRLEVNTGWWCETGNDLFSRLMEEHADRDGIEKSLFQRRNEPRIRLSTSFSLVEDRGFVSHFAGPESLPDHATLEQTRPRILLVQGLTCRAGLADLFRSARSLGIRCFLDCQHVAAGIDLADLAETLSVTDCFMPNETEALRITGAEDYRMALDQFTGIVPQVVMKRGAQGVAAMSHGERIEMPAIEVEVIDTTGAGDSFNAGFVYGLLQDQTFEDALCTAIHCGAAAVTAHGGHALPTQEQLHQSLRQTKRYPMAAALPQDQPGDRK